jgi:spectinomycin phosphotransferase/16S rRNA (guanine(1405)-N(7))-methyltransferase
MDHSGDLPDWGPYARPAADLIAGQAAAISRLLGRYDDLVAEVGSQPSRLVITHGEPHPGNTMLTKHGWRLIDWDTVLIAPPERDLWSLDLGDGAVLAAYSAATGVRPSARAIDLYRVQWDLKDLAIDVSRFRRPHPGGAEDEKTWKIVNTLVNQISS